MLFFVGLVGVVFLKVYYVFKLYNMVRVCDLPEWVLQFKVKGTEVHGKGGKYYLYKVRSVRVSGRKNPKKITGRYLGVITPEGVKKPKHERVLEELQHVVVKEYGATHYLLQHNRELIDALKKAFPGEWKEILCCAVFRVLYQSPLKNLGLHYATSFLSETVPGAVLSPRRMGELLRQLGLKRHAIIDFLRQRIPGTECMIVDGTHLLSKSQGVDAAVPGYNSKRVWDPQIRLMLIHSLDTHHPVYYRFVTGSLNDMSAVALTIQEAGITNAVLIGDKGFYSKDNIKHFEKQSVHYILPIKRNSTHIDYNPLQSGDKRHMDGYFLFQNRHI